MDLIECEERQGKVETLFSQESSTTDHLSDWEDHFQQSEVVIDHQGQENFFPEIRETVLSPEGFFPLRVGMRVRHAKFGDGRVRSVEGMDEEQKATIVFQTVGSKHLKVRQANLEILE
jgi:hypothetical protein